ncbi:peroxisomal biogenesis factor 2 isoform X1 [Oratosquilla oratoria]|uniref:peroxisomal biogenesis factor 2 isoform X1 n=1 Tax=Oratosquilla oratoria TaxID=337810 RepID=UPI003F75AD36
MGEHIKDKEYVPRITLLDAQYLDSEIYSLVKGQLRNATKYLGQSTAVRYEHEFDAVLRYIILNNTLQRTRSTIGQHLLKTKYQDTVSIGKMQFFVLASVMGHWLKERAHLFMKLIVRNPSKQHIIAKLVNVTEAGLRFLNVLNSFVFLWEGIYPSPLERLFKMRPVAANPDVRRKISYVYFTRELLWHGFADLLTFILPLINVERFHAAIKKCLPGSSESSEEETELDVLHFSTCSFCNQPPVLPHSYGCRHIACYYCIRSNFALAPALTCPLCTLTVENISQINPTRLSAHTD